MNISYGGGGYGNAAMRERMVVSCEFTSKEGLTP